VTSPWSPELFTADGSAPRAIGVEGVSAGGTDVSGVGGADVVGAGGTDNACEGWE
jgi:hypothetical protein